MYRSHVPGLVRSLYASFFIVFSGWFLHRCGFHYGALIRWLSFWAPLGFLGARAASALTVAALLEQNRDLPVPSVSLSKGLPPGCNVLLAMPCLLYDVEQAKRALAHLEDNFLANRDSRLHCALVTDHEDGAERRDDSPSARALLDFCCDQIREFNRKYGGDAIFYLLHRRQIYARNQRCWMGWERKRGKVQELNMLLLGQQNNLEVRVGKPEALRNIRYVALMDEDTTIRTGAIRHLVGVLLHPMHTPVWDEARTRLISGYGIAQPALVDISAGAKSVALERKQQPLLTQRRDPFQVIYSETTYRGKGLYDVAVFSELLRDRLPEDLILSHDVVEGLVVRPIYVPVIFEQCSPHGFDARASQSHRWMRGNWQNLFFSLRVVLRHKIFRYPDYRPFPLRWILVHKCLRGFDDLAMLLLLVALVLNQAPPAATCVAICFCPQAASLASFFSRRGNEKRRRSTASALRSVLKNAERQERRFLLRLALGPLAAYITVDACVVSVARLVTGKRLLAWRTGAQASSNKGSNLQTRSVISVCVCIVLFPAVCVHFHTHIVWGVCLSLFWLMGTLFLAPELASSLDGNAL
jgi:cyclic beta-1,2-glucan synthetase